MPDIKNNIKVIYNTLAKEGYNDLGTEQEFAESMADENNRKLIYNTLKGKEFADVKDYDSFSNMVYQQPKARQQQEEETKPVEPARIDPRFVAPNVGKPTDAQPILKGVQQGTGFVAPQDYNPQNAFLSNVGKNYNVASHIPDAQQPIKMYGTDSNLGEVIDNLYIVYDEAYKKDNPQKIAEAVNMARSMGLDNEQAEKALTLVHGLYSQNVANNMADYLYSRMNNGDPLYALKEVYYDKGFQKKLKDTATRLGLRNTQGFVEYYLKPAMQRKLQNERGYTGNINFGIHSGDEKTQQLVEVFGQRKAEEERLQQQVDAMRAEGERLEEQGERLHDPNYKNRPWWADLIPVEGGGRSAYDEAEGIHRNPEAEKLMRTGQAMQRMAGDAQAAISEDNILRTRKTDGLTNQIKNAFGRILRGGAKTATDIRTWDFGFTDLKDATVIKAAADAYANNRATAAQKALLNAVALKNAVMGKHGDALGGLYGAAGTTIQMAPYMMQFAASPVKGVGVGFQKYCRTQLEKAFGKYATEAVGKFVIKSGELAGRFAGDVAQGAAMTTIFNMPAVAADTKSRMTGDLEATTDSKGNIVYSGKRTNVKSGGRAFAEAFTAQTIENQSELVGEYFAPLQDFIQKSAIKALDKWGLVRTKDFLTGINNKQLMKGFNRFTKKTEWNKLLGETGEEFIGNIENAATVGDLNFKLDPDDDNSVFSKKVNTDIILGVGLGCGIISGARVGSYLRNNRKLNTAINDADTHADVIFGTDRWQQIKSEIDNAPDDKAGNLLQSYIDNTKLNNEQKQTIVDYTVNTYIKRGNDISQLKNAIEDNISSEQQEVQSAYENGQNARDAQMNEVKTSLDEAEKHAAELLGEDELNALDGVEDVDAFKESNAYKSYSEEQRETALKYIIARTAYNGMINRVQDEIKAAVNKTNAEIDNLTHKDSGTIIRAALKNGDQEVYVVSGNVATSPDGKSIDTEKSDSDIVVYNTENGKKEMLNIKDLQSVDTPIDAATYKADSAAETTRQIAEAEAAKIDGTRSFHYNDTVKVQDKEGNLIDGSVQDVTPDGVIVVSDAYPGGKTYTAEELTAMQPQTVAENTTVAQPAEEAVTDNESNGIQTENEVNSSQSETTPQQETSATQQQAIPTDEKGNLLYHQAPVELTIKDLYDGALDDAEIADFVSANIEAAQKEYDKVVKKAPKIGTDKARYLQEKKAYQAETDKAKAKVDYWQAVEDERQRITHTMPAEVQAKEDELSGEAARQDFRNGYDGSQQFDTAEDLTRDFLRSAKITPESFRDETGLPTTEQQKFVGTISKQGKTIAKLAEELADYDETSNGGIFFHGDSNAARSTIIDALVSSRSRADFKAQTTRAEEDEYVRQAEQQREQWYYENYHMTYEEYLQYEETVLPELLRKYANFAPDIFYPQFAASFEDAYAAEHSQTDNIENGEQGNDTTTEEPATTPGDAVLQGEETHNSGRDSQSKEQGREVQTGLQGEVENATVSETTQGEVDKEPLSEEAAQSLITSMEENAIEDPEIRLTPQTWLETFGINNSIDTPIGKVRMGENQYVKLQDKKRTSEFGMVSLTLSDPDVIFVEPSKAKGEDVAERNFSYVFAKTFKRNGNKLKYYTSVTVSIDGLEISVSSHFVNPNKMLNKLMEFNREYTKETLFSNSSEMRLAEHQSDVPDLLPTQENNVSSIGKDTQSSQTKQEKENKFSPTPRKDGESILDFAERVATEHQSYQERKTEEAKVDTNPTEAQKEAGNYKKGHIKVDGLDITIEQPKGSIRRGTDANGKQWESEMHNTYGYIRGTESVDGDHIDIFLSDNPAEGNVFVVDQVNKDGSFDEHKVMYGFPDLESAKQAYLSNYEEGWQGLGNITEVSKEDFKKWIDSSKRKTKPFAEYTSVKTQGDMQTKKPTEAEDFARQDLKELEDFQKNTDTTGRTAIDENRYDAEDLFAALKLDGKPSKLGVLTVVPDKITDPVVQIAVYDYSDEIDDRTNSGWQEWSDLADEYNKTVDDKDKATERTDTATLGFRTVDAAVKFNDWLNTSMQTERTEEAQTDVAAPAMTEEEYLASKGLGSPMSDHMLDKTRIPHGETARQKARREREAEKAMKEHAARKKDARKEYQEKLANGELREPTKEETEKNRIDTLIRTANGHEDNPSVQAARRILDKRGIDWQKKDGQINTQTEENHAHNSEEIMREQKNAQLQQAINAHENANREFTKFYNQQLKEGKLDKAFESEQWRDVLRKQTELQKALLQLNSEELKELLKQTTNEDTKKVIKEALDEVLRQEQRSIEYNAVLDKQEPITPIYKEEKKPIAVTEFVETDKKEAEIRPVFTGVYHDDGYVVGTNAHILLARKEDYDKSLEGKITNKKGEVIDGKYPNWRAIVEGETTTNSWGINLDELHAFVRGVLAKLKADGAKKSTIDSATIAFKDTDGKIIVCNAKTLDKALRGAKSIGATEFGNTSETFAHAQTKKGYVVCPTISTYHNINDNCFVYTPKEAARQQTTATLTNDTEAKQKATETILTALNKAGIEVIQATDEQAQEMLGSSKAEPLKTPQGTVYGWTVNGKIYLTKSGLNPETPVHEYTHLWAEAMMGKNKQGWNSIKTLLKDTPVWNEVINDSNYSNIKDNEDAVASEVLSRISGRKNAAKMEAEAQKAIDKANGVFEKAEATTVLLKLKKALKQFWHWVGKNVFGIKDFKNIKEVTDRVLYDLINSTDLNSGTVTTVDGVSLPSRINVVEAETNHGFKNFDDGRKWARKNIARTYDNEETNGKGNIRISNTAIDKFMSEKAVAKSESKDVHMAVLKVLPDVIRESVDAEQHEDRIKDENGIRKAGNTVNPDVMIHRLYGAVDIVGKIYRVKVTLKENVRTKETSKAYSYEATKIELLSGQSGDVTMTSPRNDNNSILTAKLLKDVEKSYSKGVKLLKDDKNSSDPRFQIADNSLSDEEKQIVENAKANNTYMKAPNGKPTNLNGKQWAQVRTKAFKDWFGDWEKAARIEKLRRSKAVKITEADYGGKYELTRNSAKQWAKDNIRGEYTIADTGEKVNVSKVSINEVLSHGERDAAHLKSISSIGKLLHNAIFITETPNAKDNDKYESYRYYVEGIKIDGVNYTAKLVIGVKNGKTYYDHRLTQIEKGSLLDSLNGLSNSVAEKQQTSFTGKDSKLLSILQTNSSKVVDENGEPMVVYHGSNNEFTKFDTTRIDSSTGTSDGRGFYFTTDKDYAYSFGKDGNVLSVFLNIDNPLSLKEKTITKRQLFDIIKRIDEKEVAADGEHWFISNYANYYDVGIEGAIREATESEYPYSDNDVELVNSLISASGNFKDVVNSVYEITGKSSEIVPKENDTVHYVVTNPNQIKSATGNNGNFSTTEDDILYRTIFGGNSGYVGYSLSKRAAEAKEEDRYPKTEFKREYHITEKSLDMLTRLGFIDNSEWHHTSMYGNKTPFYGWTEDEFADDYLKHKKEIDTLCKGIDPKTKQPLLEKVEKPQYEHDYELPQYNEAEAAVNPIRAWRFKQIDKYDEFTGFKGYTDATEEEKAEREAYMQSLREQMEKKIQEKLAKDFPDYLAAKNTLDAYNNYEENLRKAIGERIKEYLDIDKYSQRWRKNNETEIGQAYDFAMPRKPNHNIKEKLKGKSINRNNVDVIANRLAGFDSVYGLYEQIDYRKVKKTVDLTDYYNGTETTFKALPIKGFLATKQKWEELKRNKELEWHQSPLSNSEYLINRKTGDIYRCADHWGVVASCDWDITGEIPNEKDFYIGVSNIADFKAKPYGRSVIATASSVRACNQGIVNIKDILNDPTIKITPTARPVLERTLARLKDFREDLLKNNTLVAMNYRQSNTTTQPTADIETLIEHAESVVRNLHLDNVEIVPDGSSLNGRQATAKGFYNKRTGKIIVVASNHTDIADIEKTVLHEAVAHYGLRQLFGNDFDKFLDTVFAKSDIETRRQIAHLSAKHGWNVRTATEEYLASMAEDTNFEQIKPTLWQRIKQLFGEIMSAFGLHHAKLTDNDLRYMLWRSYKNLQGGGKRSILDMAEDIATQYRLKVGNHADKFTNELNAVNERFNEELSNLTEDNADKVALWLGKPSKVLLAAGVEDKPMKLYGNKVIRKMKKHGFSLEELRNLPRAVADPIAVFDNIGREGNRSVLTELHTENGNFLVAIDLGKGKEDIDFNIISSVFGKGDNKVVDWINKGFATYINKEKALNYLHHSAPIAEALSNSRLSSAAKIIKDFHNPKLNSNVLYRSSIDPTATEVLPDARTRYEEETKEPDNIGSVPKTHNFFRRFYKSYVDSMLALKSFTSSVLEATGDKMASHEDTYKAENAMTSKNKTDGEVYNRDYYNPLLTAAQQLCEAVGMDYDALNMYMVAKHGLERNEYMGKRAAQNEENVLKAKKSLEDALAAYNEDPTSENETAVQKAQEKYSKVYDKALEVHTSRDYSGLTELTGKEDVAEAEYEAQKIVDAVETPDAMPKVTAFWSKVNAATKQTLKTGYESGIMTKDTYEHILNMYKYYIPLRGWAKPTADDVYTYYNNRSYEGKPLTKTAKGRTSLAEDPMAIIASMAQRSIIEANRNKMKQTFLNFVLNHPTSLATVGEQWYIKNALGEWERSDANIPTDATPDEISKIIEEHELEMQRLAEQGTAIKQRNGLKLDKRVINGEGAEHTIKVWRGGKEYIIYINGNPAVAQAVNGLTNPDTQGSDLPKWAKIGAAQLKNFLSGVYTSFSPAFVLTNFTRDQLFASQAVYIKYGLKYKRQASKNARNLFFSGALPRLVYKWEHGTLDMNDETERYFDEFMRGGGETGFTALRDIESIKKEVKDAINGNKANIAKRGWKSFINAVEFANRSAEDFSRFVTFMTSRQQGKNIVDAIYDAKDITVNFNKKGSGEMGSRFMNFAYIFFNAAVQSINNFGTMLKQHPARTMLVISKFGALGFGVPMLNAFLTGLCGGGDDDKYWDNMDWVRRNNIVLRLPFLEKTFISIPLPQELRPFYGMGEIAASILFGKETFSSGQQKAVEGFTGLLPIDFTGNGGNLPITLTPTVLQPVAQYMFNTDYFGRKVYNDNEKKKFAPGWTKAFSSTPPVLIEATKFLNSLTGGNDVDRGAVSLNPDVINHFVKGYFGGPATFVTQMSSLLYKGFSGNAKEIRWRDVPVASRFVQQLDERSVRSSAQGSYKDFKEETEETEYRLSNYKKQVKMGKMEYAKMITDLIKSPEYQRYKIAKAYKKPMDLLQETLNHIDNTTDKKEVEKALTGLRHYMMETVESEQKGKHAKREEDFNYLGDSLSELNNNLNYSLRSLKRNEEQRLDGEEDDDTEEFISEDKETTMRIIREMNKLFKKK